MDGEFLLRAAVAAGINEADACVSPGVRALIDNFLDAGLLEQKGDVVVGTDLAIDALGLTIPEASNPFDATQAALEQTIGDVAFRIIPAAFLAGASGLDEAIALVKVVQTPDEALVQNVLIAKHLLEKSPAGVRMATKAEATFMMLVIYPARAIH